MRSIALIAFIVFPLVELAILIKLGSILGFWPTFSIVIGTALIGTAVMQRQGLTVLRRAEEAVSQGRPPVGAAVDGIMLAAAGLMLITPGIIADCLGFMLLIPQVRTLIARSVFKRIFGSDVAAGTAGKDRQGPGERLGSQPNRGADGQGPVIDGEYERLD